MRARAGYVLLSVLWFLTAVAVVGSLGMLTARAGLATASNRAALARAEWQAEDCIARARAALSTELRAARDPSGGSPAPFGLGLRRRVLGSPDVRNCPGDVELLPAVTGLSLKSVDGPTFAAVLRRLGVPESTADSLADAFLDWRDPDDRARPRGAERDWYESRGKRTPRNGTLVSVEELLWIRGFEEWFSDARSYDLSIHFTVEEGRLFIDLASDEVLLALPGSSDEVVAMVGQRRREEANPLPDLLALVGSLPPASARQLSESLDELRQRVTVAPDSWILRARSSGVRGAPRDSRLRSEIELLLILNGRHHSVVRRWLTP